MASSTHVQNKITIENARKAIEFFQQLIGEVESGNTAGRNHRPILGFNDFIWNDQVIMATFKICSKTVGRRRVDGKFLFFKIGRTYYYYRDDILPLRGEYVK